jgi:hypothetical protein
LKEVWASLNLKNTLPKQVYRKYKTLSTNMEPPKPNSLKKTDGAQSSIDKKHVPPK